MTNEYTPDSQSVHESAPDEEHPEQSVEVEAGPNDDHPPIDDFADTDPAMEEEAMVSQEAETDAGEGETASSAGGRSRSMLPLIAGIGGFLLISVVVYWQFGHSSSSPSPSTIAMHTPPKLPSSASADTSFKSSATPAPVPATASSGAPTDISGLYQKPPPPPSNELPLPEATSPAANMAPSPAQGSSATAAASSGQAGSMAPSGVPQNISAESAPSAAANTDSEARFNMLTARIDELQTSLGQATQELNQINGKITAAQVMPPVAGQANPALEDRLDKIEQNLMQIQHSETAAPAAEAYAPETAGAPQAQYAAKTASSHRTASAKHRKIHKKPKHTYRRSKLPSARTSPAPAPAAVMRASSSWILRAATPNEAWVSSNAASPDLQHVEIGSVLPGIGRVEAIRQSASGWEIVGSSGIVR